jgi:ribosomal protein S18 acetylase RimI-like enzyme
VQVTVRLATIADAARLSELGAATFRDTFEGENTPDDIARYLADSFSASKQAEEIADPSNIVLLAEREGRELVGYAHLAGGPPPPDVKGPIPMEIKRLYVGRQWHGQGVAQSLMDAAIEAARTRGAKTLWLGVWERNPRAVSFYRKYGFERVGEHTFLLGSDPQTDWLMARSV